MQLESLRVLYEAIIKLPLSAYNSDALQLQVSWQIK